MLINRLKKVIDKKSGNFLITGPPGTGKTYILIELARYLVNTEKIDPCSILVFSFNRRWAKIIREKTTVDINRSILEIPINTFYSFCIDFLEKANAGNYSGEIKVLNSTEQWRLLREVIENLDRKNYPYTSKYMRSSSFIAGSYMQEIFDFILRAQENMLYPLDLSSKFTPFFNPVLSELVGIYARYSEELHKNKTYNYGRLLGETARILKNEENIRNFYKRKYMYILVDELHEINKAQLEILKYLSSNNCIFFGNDDESIYAFRGSMVDNFQGIYDKLQPENVLFLDKNYRSSRVINEASQNFISLNKNRILKNCSVLRHEGNNSCGEVVLKECSSLSEEINFICDKIKYLHISEGINAEDIAVIVKGLGYETHLIESALQQRGISFVRRSSRSLLDNEYVKYIINFMRLAVKVSRPEEDKKNGTAMLDNLVEDILLSDAINLEPLYFKRIKFLYSSSKKNGGREACENLWHYITNIADRYGQVKKGNDMYGELKKISGLVGAVEDFLQISSKNVFDFASGLIKDRRVGFVKYLKSKDNGKFYEKNLWDSLGDFLKSIKKFCQDSGSKNDVASYVGFLDSIIENQFLEEIEESTKDFYLKGAVQILSFHQCKGFEFKAVFLPFINKGYLPSKFNFPQTYDVQIFNYFVSGKNLDHEELEKRHLEEERKLFYIGITRASEYLYITSNKRKENSLFYEELSSIYKKINPGEKLKHATQKKKLNKDKITAEDCFELDDYLARRWLVKKRAVVNTAKLLKGNKLNFNNYLRQLYFLKHFYPPGRWWGSINHTKNKNNPFLIFPAVFSYSSLNEYMECPFKYKLKYFINIKEEENLNLKIGKIYHEILRLFFESGDKELSWEVLGDILKKEFDRHDFEFKFVKKNLMERAAKEFKSFFDKNLPDNPEKSIMEKKFTFYIDNDYVTGRIDQINFTCDDKIELVDYKSSSTRFNELYLQEEIQLKLYRLAVDLSEELSSLRGKEYRLKYICLGVPGNPVCEIPLEYYDSDKFMGALKNIILKIKRERFSPNPKNYMSCMSCNYKILCPRYYGEQF